MSLSSCFRRSARLKKILDFDENGPRSCAQPGYLAFEHGEWSQSGSLHHGEVVFAGSSRSAAGSSRSGTPKTWRYHGGMRGMEAARDRLAVALDVPDLAGASDLIAALGGASGWLKVGLELYTAAGPAAVEMAGRDARVFLDLKLHDIPNTVASAVSVATRSGASLLTLHAQGGRAMLRAARDAAADAAAAAGVEQPILVAITVLTSLTVSDLGDVGVAVDATDIQVQRLAELAVESGVDGVVASPVEAAALRQVLGPEACLVTPGIRTSGDPADDQERVATPRAAIAAGADLLVVGRPVRHAPDPGKAARRIVDEIGLALG